VDRQSVFNTKDTIFFSALVAVLLATILGVWVYGQTPDPGGFGAGGGGSLVL
jgi:hypothetical protein